jgi:hypothetical protein
VAEELGNLGTFVTRFDFRFTGAPGNTGFADDVPSEGGASVRADGAQEGTAFREGDKVSGVMARGILGAPIGIGECHKGGVIMRPAKCGGQIRRS